MAVPSSGEISLLGIWSEKNESDYTAMSADGENAFSLRGLSDDGEDDSLSMGQINLNPRNIAANRPNQSTPHAMSEFYSYDHDEASIAGYMVDDFQGTPTSTRANFNTTTLGDSLTAGDASGDANGNSTSVRPDWSTLGGATSYNSGNHYIKMANTSNSNHSQWRTTDVDQRDGMSATSISVSGIQFVWEFGFYIASAGNKDLRFVLEAGSSVPTGTWNSGGSNFKIYAFTFDDQSGYIRWQRWGSSGSQTTVVQTSNSSFSYNTNQVCKITKTSGNLWNITIDGTSVMSNTKEATNAYTNFYGYRFWTAKSGNTGTDNRVNYIKTYRE